MSYAGTLALLAAVAAQADPPAGAGRSPSVGEAVVVTRCETEYERSSLLGAPATGVIQECSVRPGDVVREGQVLGRLQDKLARAELAVREAEAASDVVVRLAEAKHAQAAARLRVTESLKARNVASVEEYNAHKLDVTAARLAAEDAVFRRGLARLQAEQSAAAVRAREVVAPHDGVVVAVYKKAGESVASDAPVLKLVDPRRVLVTGYIDVRHAWQVKPGRAADVVAEVGGVELEIEKDVFPARVEFVDPIVDPRTQTCKVIASVDNPDGLLRAGLPVRLEIRPAADRVAGPAPGPGREGPRR